MEYYLTNFDDVFTGTALGEDVHGLNGNDVIYGNGSPPYDNGLPFLPDILRGDGGNDKLYITQTSTSEFSYAYGGDGNDYLISTGPGEVGLFGDNGNDHLTALHGRAYLYGQAGADTLSGGADAHMEGGWGNDHLIYHNYDLVQGYGASLNGGRGADIFEIHIDPAIKAFVGILDFKQVTQGDKLWVTLDRNGKIITPVKALWALLDTNHDHHLNGHDAMVAPDFGVSVEQYSLLLHLGGENLVSLQNVTDFHIPF